jgi:hypothetical protein
MGMSVAGLALLGITFIMLASIHIFGRSPESFDAQTLPILSGFALGASCIAMFARVGGGIYTKAADVGADLVGKVEAGIPEDDPRNPAVIADLVGDNVGDVAGMGADLFESYVGAIVSGMIIAAATLPAEKQLAGVSLALLLSAVGIVASIIGTFCVRTAQGDPQVALRNGTVASAALAHRVSSTVPAMKAVIGRLLEAWCIDRDIEFMPYGSWTLKERRQGRGAEPDECYVFGRKRTRRPHLAIEVEWTRGGIDKLEVYRRLGVGEIWYWRRGAIVVFVLEGDAYHQAPASRVLLDLDLPLLASFLDRPTVTQAVRDFRTALAKRAARAATARSKEPRRRGRTS